MMTTAVLGDSKKIKSLYDTAFLLSMFTIFYNLLEGVFSVYFGFADETLALFGFGLDSFVEILSGAGIAHMIYRIRKNKNQDQNKRDEFEINSLRITGTSFYILGVSVLITIFYNFYYGHYPQTTKAGVLISSLSLLVMFFLIRYKLKVGRELQNDAIVADANCTRACFYLSAILLISSLLFELTGMGFMDSIGSIGVVYYAFKEGKEAFDRSRGKLCGCESGSCST